MRKQYLLFGVCSLIFHQAFPRTGEVYTLTKKENSVNLLLADSHSLLAVNVTGKITDESGTAFPGVNVLVKGTTTGTSTDSEGKYTLSVPDENSILVFSAI